MTSFKTLITSLKSDMNIYLIRHGQSIANRTNIIQGRSNSPLSSMGRRQAEKVAKWVSNKDIQKIVSSPLIRAHKTAEIISGRPSTELSLWDDLVEIETGIFSARSVESIEKETPDLWQKFQMHSWDGVEKAEKSSDILKRAYRVWNKIICMAEKKVSNCVIVSHGGFIQWLFRSSFDILHCSWMPLLSVSNCGIFHLNLRPVFFENEHSCHSRWVLVNHRLT